MSAADAFDKAWVITKDRINPSAGFPRERCFICEKVKDTYGRYPNRPFYPRNWNKPCPCSERDF